MSDLSRVNPPTGSGSSSRPQNGGSRVAQGTGPTPATPTGVKKPSDVMEERRRREALRAQQEAAQRRNNDERLRRPQEGNVAGVEAGPSRIPGRPNPGTQSGQLYTLGGPSSQPAGPAGRQENIPPGSSRPSGGQQHAGPSAGNGSRVSANTQRNRTEAFDRLNIPAGTLPPSQRAAETTQQPPEPASQPNQSRFPGAFERWEALSAQWEGLTSYWIHRLQENANELDGKPLDQQISRQIADLSAAGANLFHALVQLQGLRMSSERKFNRWFEQTQLRQQESQVRLNKLEAQLQNEQAARNQSSSSIEVVRAERTRAEELVKEMQKELRISKEEARRAWEELGRREQEERERTIALRSGEPTLIGGVQVVPMQGIPSRQVSSAQRPQTRDGPYPGGPTVEMMGGHEGRGQHAHSRSQTTTTTLESPAEEHRQFTYQPSGTSPTGTDPFVETAQARDARQTLRHEPDTQFYSTPARPTQPQTSAAAIAASRSATSTSSPARSYTQTVPGTNGRFYQQGSTETAVLSPITTVAPNQGPVRSGAPATTSPSDGRSYIPSSVGSASAEDEYQINPDGSYTLDTQGRPIPYNQPIRGRDELSDDEDDDYASDIAREQMYAQQYGINPARIPAQQQPQPSSIPRINPPSAYQAVPRTEPDYEGTAYGTTPTTQARMEEGLLEGEEEDQTPTGPGEGSLGQGGYQDPAVASRNRYLSTLSDIPEEARTSPNRSSYVSSTAGAPGVPRMTEAGGYSTGNDGSAGMSGVPGQYPASTGRRG